MLKSYKEVDIKEVHSLAMTILKKIGGHQLMALIQEKDGVKLAALVLDQEDKGTAREALRLAVSGSGCERYFVVAECWMTMAKPGERPPILPSLTRNPKEVLVVEEYRKDQRNRSMMTPFTRKGGKIVPGKTLTPSRSERVTSVSIWNVFLEKEGVDERMDLSVRKGFEDWQRKQAKRLSKKYFKDFQEAKTDSERVAVLERVRAEVLSMKKDMLNEETQ